MPQPASRLEQLPTYVFAVIGERVRQMAAEGIDIIRLDIGSPDMPPPDFVIDKLSESAHNKGNHGYSDYRGTPDYRAAVAKYYGEHFELDINPNTEILPLLGSKEGIVNLAMAYLGPGDLALVPEIGYPSYTMGARLAGANVYYVPMSAGTDFLPDLDAVPAEIAAKAKILWINYPNNPTGAVASPEFYQRAVDFCRTHDLLLGSDNPYIEIVYDGRKPISALQATDAKDYVVEFLSMSKSYNMAGWRLGAAVGSATAIKNLLKVKSNVDSGHFKAVFDAGTVALTQTPIEWGLRRNQIYQERRDKIMTTLPEIGLRSHAPKGALYVWAEVENGDAAQYLEDALCTAHVVLAPGAAYGPSGQRYIRFGLTVKDERLDEALDRLKKWYNSK